MAVFNPFVPSYKSNPYRQYSRLRADDPVHRSQALGAWVLTRYADCLAVLRDQAAFSSDARNARGPVADAIDEQRRGSPLGRTPTVLTSDPPDHTRLRGIVTRAFTPRRVAELRPHIEEIARDLLADAPAGEFELMAGLAQPLPVIVIAELLGVPSEDRARFKEWSNAIAATTNVVTREDEALAARQATEQLVEYFGRVVSQRRREPREDLISALVTAEEDGQRLSEREVLAFAILLLVAGNETTTNLIGNGTLALLEQPEQAQRLRDDPSRLAGGIEEMLRYDSPVQGVVRFATRDVEVGGRLVSKGDIVLAMLGAANRDPEQFPEPDTLDVAREDVRHLSFGMGIHFCLGAPLARLEAQVAFGVLLERFPHLQLGEGGRERGGTFLLRGPSRLSLAGGQDRDALD
ncbi:MAG: cytochrome P450 [Dehalococcoidia bacterium]|nr:cytochrome P450 [Dehalococcoidia bacterium]